MKIILVGCGKIGYTIAKSLSENEDIDVTVIDENSEKFEEGAEPLDVIFIEGNGANEQILTEAGAQDADLIVCTAGSDEMNVLCCIMAEHLGTKHSIARVRNPEYMLEYNKLWKDLGIDVVINPERMTAREISRILRYSAAQDVDTFIGGRVEMVTFKVSRVPEYFTGKKVAQIFDKSMGVLLAVVERKNKAYIPSGDFVFEDSDIIKIMGRPSEIMSFFTRIMKHPKKQQNVMVIGGGRITHYLVELLNRHTKKMNIKIIEKNQKRCEALYDDLSAAGLERRCLFISGDGTNEDLLDDEEINHMDALVCLTDRDEENAIIALYGLQEGVGKVITKVNHIHQNMINSLGLALGSIITPQNITADSVLRYVDRLHIAAGSNIRMMHRIVSGNKGNIDAVEFQVNKKSKCIGISLKELQIKNGTLVGCINRGAKVIIPSGETKIQLGDSVIIIAENNEILDLDDILLSRIERITRRAKVEQEDDFR